MVFANRIAAGRELAKRLGHLAGQDLVILGLPRGGVPVAAEVARALAAPLDVIVVRKLGVPDQPELAMGALGEDGVQVLNPDVLRMAQTTAEELERVHAREQIALSRLVRLLRGDRPAVPVAGRTAVVVDDGVATGATARAACQIARARGAAQVILAAPVLDATAAGALRKDADDVIGVVITGRLSAVGRWYDDFAPVPDDLVSDLLAQASDRIGGARITPPRPVEINADGLRLLGLRAVPQAAAALVIFAHGSGSGRHSPRNRYVADVLNRAGLGTLLIDLLTPAEEADRAKVFDIELLASRLTLVTTWAQAQPWGHDLAIGWFGASTGAAAALWAAAALDASAPARGRPAVSAIVSRGGRPDLAADRLGYVRIPTLLIVGSHDTDVLRRNRVAARTLAGPTELIVVPGATHLFEEPGALATVAAHARDWFVRWLPSGPGSNAGPDPVLLAGATGTAAPTPTRRAR